MKEASVTCLSPLSDLQKLEREARICRMLKHPNIGKFKSNYTPRDMSKCTSSTLLRHKHCVHVQSSLPPYHTSTLQFSYIMCSRKTMSATWYLTCKLHFHTNAIHKSLIFECTCAEFGLCVSRYSSTIPSPLNYMYS